ncbi:MAG: phosphoenolpyruvate--protein phosphotransferase [Devosia nanyangense]|uniref:Phosphoenolpyruvate-protein phosphotransferase n=1 Tax=Devosia nanyangense TaxID=1228055 RepID=A0A933NYW6_9HYPH|nr:phosphoenolpyruvate--protein phosphotransferase [Devosia nanyangense]
MPTLRATGTVASIGYASGPLFIVGRETTAYRPSGDHITESERLFDAMDAAAQQVETLASSSDGDAAEILEFQAAMLRDASLSESAIESIVGGIDAATSWSDAMRGQIADYEGADNAYFRARSADLQDIHDRVLRLLTGEQERQWPPGAVLHARDLTPTEFLSMDWTQGGAILLHEGSAASHVAMLARTRGVPMLVGVGVLDAANNDLILVDAERGRVIVLPDTEARHEFLKASTAHRHLMNLARSRLHMPAVTADGARIEVLVNIADPSETEGIDIATCDGVGLMRTEFLFGRGLPGEEAQLAAYRRVLAWAGGKPVTIRTVDAGGDKPVPGFTVEESNPFLGLRGIRLSLSRPDVFRVQARALLRAAPSGNLKVMFPMVGIAAEYAAARAIFAEEATALGLPVPPLGIMVEVPAVAIHPAPFRDVAFFSIGSNDLTQYVMAAGRDNGAVAALNDARHPAVLRLIREVVAFAEANGITVSLCGDAGGDPGVIPQLIGAGLRTLSVAPAQLALAKAAISSATTSDPGHGQI